MKASSTIISNLETFKNKEKFIAEDRFFYPGVRDASILNALTEKIDKAADDFKEVAASENPTNARYQEKISLGLSRFTFYIDSEDQDRICRYFEELMDIVGLESSGGLLNEFRYGFNPGRP